MPHSFQKQILKFSAISFFLDDNSKKKKKKLTFDVNLEVCQVSDQITVNFIYKSHFLTVQKQFTWPLFDRPKGGFLLIEHWEQKMIKKKKKAS